MEHILTFLLRCVFGTLVIHFVNLFLNHLGIIMAVGVNYFTLGFIGFLGLPGLLALYGYELYLLL